MKKSLFLGFAAILLSSGVLLAEDKAPATDAAAPESAPAAVTTESAPAMSEPAAPAVTEAPAATAETAAPDVTATAVTTGTPTTSAPENLEFVSGEVTSIDEAAKKMTVKLYGDTEDAATDKILTVTLDENTDVTDGEKDRDLKSLTPGTEVDVEYDATSSKATYIFVY